MKTDPYDPQIKWVLTLQKQHIDLSTKDLKKPDAWWNQIKEADEKIATKIKAKMLTYSQFKGETLESLAFPK
ncbi:hypothetical protein ABEY62_04175 [Priestia megaterium]